MNSTSKQEGDREGGGGKEKDGGDFGHEENILCLNNLGIGFLSTNTVLPGSNSLGRDKYGQQAEWESIGGEFLG